MRSMWRHIKQNQAIIKHHQIPKLGFFSFLCFSLPEADMMHSAVRV